MTAFDLLVQTETPVRPSGEPPVVWFVVALVATALLLVLSIWTGNTARRKAHIVVVSITVPVLGLTIFLAETVGSYWTFPVIPLRIHLSLAYMATVSVLVAAVSGVLHIFGKIARVVHARLAWLFVLLAVSAIVTGAWIFVVGTPK